jgi:hypothetical protein
LRRRRRASGQSVVEGGGGGGGGGRRGARVRCVRGASRVPRSGTLAAGARRCRGRRGYRSWRGRRREIWGRGRGGGGGGGGAGGEQRCGARRRSGLSGVGGCVLCVGEAPWCVRAAKAHPACLHFEYTLGMFGLREHRSLRPSTSKGSLRREGGIKGGREERGVRRACGRRVSETRPKRTVRGRGGRRALSSLCAPTPNRRECASSGPAAAGGAGGAGRAVRGEKRGESESSVFLRRRSSRRRSAPQDSSLRCAACITRARPVIGW